MTALLRKISGYTGVDQSLKNGSFVMGDGSSVYFMGIGGTGMTAVAGLMKEAGYKVSGSDKPMYPPMSTLLEELKINVKTPYSKENVAHLGKQTVVVVGNALSRGHEELEAALRNEELVYTSFPALLHDTILAERKNLVVTGTHGKTTTSSLSAHVLTKLGVSPGFMIGGLPRDFERGFSLGNLSSPFVIEGDEYDTAFFDKTPKFLKYRPHWLVINNIEYDHVDIYRNFEHVLEQFVALAKQVTDPERIIVNADQKGVKEFLNVTGLSTRATKISRTETPVTKFSIRIVSSQAIVGTQEWQHEFELLGGARIKVQSKGLSGEYNGYNAAAILSTTLQILCEQRKCAVKDLDLRSIENAFSSFSGVKRRLELLGQFKGAMVFEDFAHHPTAVTQLIQAFRSAYPDKRLLVAFEATNATGRRNVFIDDFAAAFKGADRIFIGPTPLDLRIPEGERMNSEELALKIGAKAKAYGSHELIFQDLKESLLPSDALIFMSPSSFGGIQHRLVSELT